MEIFLGLNLPRVVFIPNRILFFIIFLCSAGESKKFKFRGFCFLQKFSPIANLHIIEALAQLSLYTE